MRRATQAGLTAVAVLAGGAWAGPAQAEVPLPAAASPLPIGAAPAFKAMPLGVGAALTLSAESRLRVATSDAEPHQGLYRGILGAELRATPQIRAFAELGMGQAVGGRSAVGANFQNDAAWQQLYLDARQPVGSFQVGGKVGRQEFAEGPRQLVSVGDGPNLHRSWNGVRLDAQGPGSRASAFDLRGTRLERGAFDDAINPAERLSGLTASLHVVPGRARTWSVDPFWLHSENPSFRARGQTGLDLRDSVGVRFWGVHDGLKVDWVLARQTGHAIDRDVDAWGLFAAQSLGLADVAWRPRLGARLDLASGGGGQGAGARGGFNQLYASSNYLSEGLFLSTSNLMMVAPSLSLAPTPATTFAIEYGFARRMSEADAAYAGLMRAYPGTEGVSGQAIGGLLRLAGAWSVTERMTVNVAFEHFAAGEVLQRAGVPSGSYGYGGTTWRY